MVSDTLSIEVKLRQSLPKGLERAIEQSRAGAGERTPVVVLVCASPGKKARRYALLELDEFLKMV